MSEKNGRTERHDHKRNDPRDSTDPVMGWHELGKPARMQRKQKRSWRRKDGGGIAAELAGLLALATVAGVLLMEVV
ncbi:MAG: hypothetical protein ACLGH6_05410 [Gammaproteobacteria bacterium]